MCGNERGRPRGQAWAAGLAALALEYRAGDFRLDRRAKPRADDQSALLTRRHELGPGGDGDDDAAEEVAE